MFASTRIARAAAKVLTAAALSASFGFLPAAQAADANPQDRMPASYASLMKMKPMDLMHLMDPGKQGVVSKDDFMKFHEDLFQKRDKDKDGRISEQEWLARTDRSKDAGG